MTEAVVRLKRADMARLTVTLKVKGLRSLVWRARVGLALVRLGVWIIGCTCVVEDGAVGRR